MKWMLLCFFLPLFVSPVLAQKRTQQLFASQEIDRIALSSDEIYRVSIKSTSGSEIRISSVSDGEYYNDIQLNSRIENHTLYLDSQYPEILQSGYDKLSAHKVFSMEVALEIPEGMVVEIRSNLASAYLQGSYNSILVELKTGSCYLQDFSGNAVINTYNGNITGTVQGAEVEASSRHGSVNVPENSYGQYKMSLTSINGDIKLSETK